MTALLEIVCSCSRFVTVVIVIITVTHEHRVAVISIPPMLFHRKNDALFSKITVKMLFGGLNVVLNTFGSTDS